MKTAVAVRTANRPHSPLTELINVVHPLRRHARLFVEGKAYQRAALCVTAKLPADDGELAVKRASRPRRARSAVPSTCGAVNRIPRTSVNQGEVNRGGRAMKISSVMSRDVQLIKPDDTIRSAAALMKKIDAGLLPVTENDKLVGMITDRDIAIRGVAEGKGPDSKVPDAMSPEVKYCFEDEDITHVAENMAELQVRRLPVMNRDKRLVGIVSLADLAIEGSLPKTAKALHGISQPGGQHNQSRQIP